MVASTILVLMMQLTVLTKAGYINFVEGKANVTAGQTASIAMPIRTESQSYAEVLLNPGSYLRLDENSEAVLNAVEFPDIAIEIRKGSALIEAVGFNKKKPLIVSGGKLRVEILEDGLYLFADSQVTVLEGKVRVPDTNATYKRPMQISKTATVQAVKSGKRPPTALEQWSTERSSAMARGNAQVAHELRSEMNVKLESVYDVWLRGAGSSEFAYMPATSYRSPYGHAYVSVRDVFVIPGFYYNPAAPPPNADANRTPAETPTVPATPPPAPPAKKDSTVVAGK